MRYILRSKRTGKFLYNGFEVDDIEDARRYRTFQFAQADVPVAVRSEWEILEVETKILRVSLG